MVKVFKTDVSSRKRADYIIDDLLKKYSGFIISFDLGDCDNILRVEGTGFEPEDIISRLEKLGHSCEELL